MKTIIILAVIALFAVVAFFALGYVSKRQSPREIRPLEALICGSAPNCVCSQCGAADPHYVEPLRGEAGQLKQAIVQAISQTGGVLIEDTDTQIRATYTSKIFGFVDDFVVRLTPDSPQANVLSASRVGYSDLGANRKRVEQVRVRLTQVLSNTQ